MVTSGYDVVAGILRFSINCSELVNISVKVVIIKSLNFKKMHLKRTKEKQTHIICLEGLKVTNPQKLLKKEGKTLKFMGGDHTRWEVMCHSCKLVGPNPLF